MSTKKTPFQSNETLEMCDVKVSQDGRIEIATKSYHTEELARLGTPEKAVRGRVQMVEQNFIFAPYAEGSRKPTYKKQLVVGSTTLAVTEDKVKVSFMVPRHLSKPLMTLYIQSEIDEVKRRLDSDVYDSLVKASNENVNENENRHPDGKVNVNVNVNVEKKGGAA
jgi:hypothetical protein